MCAITFTFSGNNVVSVSQYKEEYSSAASDEASASLNCSAVVSEPWTAPSAHAKGIKSAIRWIPTSLLGLSDLRYDKLGLSFCYEEFCVSAVTVLATLLKIMFYWHLSVEHLTFMEPF